MYSGSEGSTPMMEGGKLLAGRYRLLEKVGEGGAAEVFRARDQRLDRTVAIKLLRPQFSYDDPSRKRFAIEAKTAAGIAHPNIVDIYDFGESDDGSMFIAMQFVQGVNLKDLLQKRGRLSSAETIAIARQACHALQAAHERGLIHRDVKPQNILIDKTGHVHLTDFGIVKALSGPALTQSGMTFGTAAYMSPEQATGAPIKAAADLYSLGCVMYEMLCGMPPFTGENPAIVAYKQVWEQPRPLHDCVAEVPPSLEMIVMRLLSKDPGRRYESAQDLVADLDALNVTSSQPTQAVPVAETPMRATPVTPHVPLAAELGQPVQMPAAPAEVPPARVSMPQPLTPLTPQRPQVTMPTPPQPAIAQPQARQAAPAAVPYTAQSARSVQVNVSQRRGRGMGMWPAVIVLVLGLLLCGLGAWQGGNLLGILGGRGGATPSATAVAQVVLPTDTAPVQVPPTNTTEGGQIVVGSPAVPSPEPFATDTPQPVTPTDTPAPPTDTPQPPPPTDTPAPPPPTDTPPPPVVPTDTPEQVEPTAVVGGAAGGIALEDRDFIGGYFRSNGLYHGVTATWVYGQATQYSTMTALFNLDNAPEGDATLTITGLDSEDATKTPINIVVNGTDIYTGDNPLPDDFRNGPNGAGNWGTAQWVIPAGVLRPGTNTLSITNLFPGGTINTVPFFMLDTASITW
ncbi:MAG: eukaryotic-like serine/threonine-protein kinase [Chloroflexia bacterium]|nr:eukaryotic-like serine/threonine-protein kinase [Chloroflexia bacterium]